VPHQTGPRCSYQAQGRRSFPNVPPITCAAETWLLATDHLNELNYIYKL